MINLHWLFFILTLTMGHAQWLHAKKPRFMVEKNQKAQVPVNFAEFEKEVIRYPGSSPIGIRAKQAILLDYTTGKTLLEKHPDERMTPSSLTKMMTSYIIEEKLQNKELSLEDTAFYVDEEAWKTGGSKTFVPLGQMVKLTDLLRGIIIQSGNDACVVCAKGIAGGEPQFAALMNAKAKALGMNNTQFKNSHGLPEEGHYSTARDLAKLGMAIIKEHSEYYSIYSEKDFTFNNITQGNRNPLIYDSTNNGFHGSCDGIKTGHTEDGGYGAVVSCRDDMQRYILVINGLPSMQARADEARKLISWAKENFVSRLVVKKGEIIAPAVKVKLGLKETIRLAASEQLHVLNLRSDLGGPDKRIMIKPAIVAPIKEGDHLGKIIISFNGQQLETSLVSLDSSEKMGFIKQALSYLGL
jgi:D-alanyl-D-alanine carboxypeptidase (penicillin-binding protein 5/6)